jgi:hypothetical protein
MKEGRIRLAAMVASAGLLACAVVMRQVIFATVGAILFVLGSALQLVVVFDASKRYRAGASDVWADEKARGIADRIAYWIGAGILLAGLVGTVAGSKNGGGTFFVPGAIIWLGAIAVWVISGVIVREVAGIPLRMGYGGWHVYRRGRRNRRRKWR